MSKIDLSRSKWTMHEFFAGSGLAAYGLKGLFRPVWANDLNPKKFEVYNANFDSSHFIVGDICEVEGRDLPQAHLSWASFPCQDLSLAGNMKGIHADRSGMFWEWLRVLDEMNKRPDILVAENVLGLVSLNAGRDYRTLHKALVDRGYKIGAILLNADRFVPQSRPRIFVIAVSENYKIPARLQDEGPNWLHNGAIQIAAKGLDSWIWWRAPEPVPRTTTFADLAEEDAPFEKNPILELIPERHLKKLGESADGLYTGYRRTRQHVQSLELRFDGIAGCLRTPNGGSSRQLVVKKAGDDLSVRLVTKREVARLMGAPDNFVLPGTYNDGYLAMGDAVVAPVVRFIGEEILDKLAESIYGEQEVVVDMRGDMGRSYPSEYAERILDLFCEENSINSKGRLSTVVQLTRLVGNRPFPLNASEFRTEQQGQVAGLSGAFIKKILAEYGITAVLSQEGGRTSRGSMGIAESYFSVLNELNENGECDLIGIENYWIDRVRRFLAGKPFKLSADQGRTISALLSDLFSQVKKREAENPGTHYLGTVLQHLVAAKLLVIMPEGSFDIHGAAVADAPTSRAGDFCLNDMVIHCTTAPGDPLVEKCVSNLEAGCRPVIITLQERVSMALQLCEDYGVGEKVEVWGIQQFLSSNVAEHSLFSSGNRVETLAQIVDRYNAIIEMAETEKSLKIDFA